MSIKATYNFNFEFVFVSDDLFWKYARAQNEKHVVKGYCTDEGTHDPFFMLCDPGVSAHTCP